MEDREERVSRFSMAIWSSRWEAWVASVLEWERKFLRFEVWWRMVWVMEYKGL